MFYTTLVIAAIGAINWGLVALFDLNLVSAIFGTDTVLTNIIYLIVAASAIYALVAYPAKRSHTADRREVHRDSASNVRHDEHARSHR